MKRLLLAVGVTALALTGCTTSPTADNAPTSAPATLTVSAASSLTEAFTALADRFERENPGVDVSLNFAGSSALAEQVNAGAPVDVLATASAGTMATVVDAGNAADPTTFARNALTIAVPADNPAGIEALADLANPDVRLAVCAPEVPCGSAAATLLEDNGISATPVTLDPDVKSVLGRVVAGEVDAGLVYVTDARAAAPDVASVPIAAEANVTTDYLIAPITGAAQAALGEQFIALVMSPEGQQELADLGFQAP